MSEPEMTAGYSSLPATSNAVLQRDGESSSVDAKCMYIVCVHYSSCTCVVVLVEHKLAV